MRTEEIMVLAGNIALLEAKAPELDRATLVLIKKVLERQVSDIKDRVADFEKNQDDSKVVPEWVSRAPFVIRKKKQSLYMVDGYLAVLKTKESEQKTIRHKITQSQNQKAEPFLKCFHSIAKSVLPDFQYQQIRQLALDKVESEALEKSVEV